MKINKETISRIADITGRENIYENEPMAPHLSMKVGGPARFFLTPCSEAALAGLIRLLSEEKLSFFILGNGSNVIVRDEGYDGIIVHIGHALSEITVSENLVTAGAGALLKDVSAAALENGLAGFEFASGIPGSVGGGVSMNAGAYGGEMKDIVKEVTAIDASGDRVILKNADMGFGYRKSVCQDASYIITGAVFELEKGDKALIKEKIEDLSARRRNKQPLEYPSSGSTFKRPQGYFAGKLIMDSGLKGCSAGGAKVSEKHCGFVINTGNATASDVISLIGHIQKTVMEKQGVALECEVRII